MAVPKTISAIWKTLTETKSFDRVLGQVKLISAGNGTCTAEMTIEEEHVNIGGTLHGGLTSTIVDVVSGIALCTHKLNPDRGVSVDLHITFLKAASLGEKIVIEARTNKVGRILAFLEVDIVNEATKKLIAKGSHTKFIGTH